MGGMRNQTGESECGNDTQYSCIKFQKKCIWCHNEAHYFAILT